MQESKSFKRKLTDLGRLKVVVPRTKKHFILTIFDNKSEMLRILRGSGIKCHKHQVGLFIATGKNKGNIGYMFLPKNYLSFSTISHECLHAAIRALQSKKEITFNAVKKRGKWFANSVEEELCYLYSDLLTATLKVINDNKLPIRL